MDSRVERIEHTIVNESIIKAHNVVEEVCNGVSPCEFLLICVDLEPFHVCDLFSLVSELVDIILSKIHSRLRWVVTLHVNANNAGSNSVFVLKIEGERDT